MGRGVRRVTAMTIRLTPVLIKLPAVKGMMVYLPQRQDCRQFDTWVALSPRRPVPLPEQTFSPPPLTGRPS